MIKYEDFVRWKQMSHKVNTKHHIYHSKLMMTTNANNSFEILVTGSSSSQKQQSVKLVNRSNLPQFLSESKPNAIPNPVAQVFTLKEEPMVFMPDKFKMKLQNNSEFVEKFWGSFENFLKLNPQPEFQVKESVKKLEPLLEPLEPHENELQKEFDPSTNTDARYQQSLNQSLKCYVNACVSENLNERAFAVLMSIRTSNPFRKHKVDFNDPELYIDLMTKYSSLRNWTRVNEIYGILLAEKIPITPQIYMIILDCLGRMNETTNNVKLIGEFINKAIEQVSKVCKNQFVIHPKKTLQFGLIFFRILNLTTLWINPHSYEINGNMYCKQYEECMQIFHQFIHHRR